ncbi:hypothetical protein [Sphingomonas sp.]|uniref:hypothetical protein n=1 Tax=Sphingomonas sp. TaxID=28214 RepID=UPI0035B30707
MFRPVAAILASAFLASSVTASAQARPADTAPTPAELRALVQSAWPNFARMISVEDRLVDPPKRLVRLPQSLCLKAWAGAYNCASILEYELTNGRQRSLLLMHSVTRNERGKLEDAILVRETPVSPSTSGIRL